MPTRGPTHSIFCPLNQSATPEVLLSHKPFSSLVGHQGAIFAADFSVDQRYLLTASEDCTGMMRTPDHFILTLVHPVLRIFLVFHPVYYRIFGFSLCRLFISEIMESGDESQFDDVQGMMF